MKQLIVKLLIFITFFVTIQCVPISNTNGLSKEALPKLFAKIPSVQPCLIGGYTTPQWTKRF